jgi:hypothetical protein
MRMKKMTPAEIAAKAKELIAENYATGTPMSAAGGIKLLKQYKRILNDALVLVRELAESK